MKSPTSVPNIVSTCKALEDARHSRIRLLSNLAPSENTVFPNIASPEALRTIVHDIVRKEMDRLKCGSPYAMAPVPESALQAMTHQEFAAALSSSGLHTPQLPHAAMPVQGSNAT